MKRTALLATAAVTLALLAGVAAAERVDVDRLDHLTEQFPFAVQTGTPGSDNHRLIYADFQTHVHVFKVKDDGLELDWETTNLGSRVTSLFVDDLYGDGRKMLAISTAGGRILFYNLEDYGQEWENLQDPFDRIDYMVAANLDDDPQHELVFTADGLLYIFDSLNRNFEWHSQAHFEAKQILIGNVDDDPQPEIILNTGTIIDSRFYSIEFQADNAFGDRISLFDLNGDGVPEIFGELLDFNLKVFDIYAERDVW